MYSFVQPTVQNSFQSSHSVYYHKGKKEENFFLVYVDRKQHV